MMRSGRIACALGFVLSSAVSADPGPVEWTSNPLIGNASLAGELDANEIAFGDAVDVEYPWAIVGAPEADGERGAVYLYRLANDLGPWRRVGYLTAADRQPGDRFGESVALLRMSTGGSPGLFIGAPGDDDRADNAGAVYLYRQDGRGPEFGRSEWRQFRKFLPQETDTGQRYGHDLHAMEIILSNSSRRQGLVVGAPGSDRVHIEQLVDWTTVAGRRAFTEAGAAGTAVASTTYEQVGAFATSGDFVLVAAGAPEDDEGGQDAGAIYLYGIRNGTSFRLGKLAGTGVDERLGTSVAVSRTPFPQSARIAGGMPGVDKLRIFNRSACNDFGCFIPVANQAFVWDRQDEIAGDPGSAFGAAMAFWPALNVDEGILVGAPGNGTGIGLVRTIRFNTGNPALSTPIWTHPQARAGDGFGSAVAYDIWSIPQQGIGVHEEFFFAADDRLAQPDASADDVFISRFIADDNELQPPFGVPSARLMSAVAGSPDAAAFAAGNRVFVFQKVDGDLPREPQRTLTFPDRVSALALSDDGRTLAVGFASVDRVEVWERDVLQVGNPWVFRFAPEDPDNGAEPSRFGHAVDLDRDGETLIVGAPVGDGRKGAAWVFRKNSINFPFWNFSAEGPLAPAGAGAESRSGYSVAIDDGVAVLGGFNSGPSGEVAVFQDTGTGWMSAGPAIRHPDVIVGRAVALKTSGDDQFLAIGNAQPSSGLPGSSIYDIGRTSNVITVLREASDTWPEILARIGASLDPCNAQPRLVGSTLIDWITCFEKDDPLSRLFGQSVAIGPAVGDSLRPEDFLAVLGFGELFMSQRDRDGLPLTIENPNSPNLPFPAPIPVAPSPTYGPLVFSGNRLLVGLGYNDDPTIARTPTAGILRPNPTDIGYIEDLLFETGSSEPDAAAFRFLDDVFVPDECVPDATDPADTCQAGAIRRQLDDPMSLWGDAERERTERAIALIKEGRASGANPDFGSETWLDILYNRTVAELLAQEPSWNRLDRLRLNLVLPAEGESTIDAEIGLLEDAVSALRAALEAGYFDLLSDPFLKNQIFDRYVPARALPPGQWRDSNNQLQDVIDCDVADCTADGNLFDSHKDLVMLFRVLSDWAIAVDELARMKLLRDRPASDGQPSDRDRAAALILEAQQRLFFDGLLLMGAFPDFRAQLELGADWVRRSGVEALVTTWQQTAKRLDKTYVDVIEKRHPLGFDGDFLMLVQKFQGQSTEIFDSFDAFRALLEPVSTNPSSPLTIARSAFDQARDRYDRFRNYEDQLATQFRDVNEQYDRRLFDVVGVLPGEPGFEDPGNNIGSEIWQQLRSVEAATIAIQKNGVAFRNLIQQVEIEVARRSLEAGVENAMQDLILDYGEQQARLTKKISDLRAAQTFLESFAEDFPTKPSEIAGFAVDVGAGAANASLEGGIGDLEAEKERLSAQERADIIGLEGQILDINSRAQVETWMLEANILVVESMEAANLARQELGRLIALLDEVRFLLRAKEEANEGLSARYFADPAHRVRYRAEAERARIAFEEAQRWMWYLGRALEFKWNLPFQHEFLEQQYDLQSIVRARNFFELNAVFDAMTDFDALLQGSLVRDQFFDRFSVKEDFLGFRAVDEDGNPLFYRDPVTGERLDATGAFRRALARRMDADGNITLQFSTVRELPGGSFFRGPRFAADGTLISKGLFLDKIVWMEIRLPGEHSVPGNTITGELSQGGTAFVRNVDVGIVDPSRADRVSGEMTAYSTRYWFFHGPSDRWRFSDELSAPVPMTLIDDPQAPSGIGRIEVFKERSVAASDWTLVVPTRDAGAEVLRIDELDDIQINFLHQAVVRP